MAPPITQRSLYLLLLGLVISSVACCPSVCRCVGQKRVSVYCDYRGLESVPVNIPLSTTHLYFMGNKFKQVLPSMFMGNAKNADGTFASEQAALVNLTVIRLDLNPLAIVNEHTFDSAPSLQLIYLPFDVRIQRQAFAEMKNGKTTFDGFTRVEQHPLEDPLFAAFSKC